MGAALVLAALLVSPQPAAAQDVLDLDIGDSTRRDKRVALVLDAIVDTHDGALLDVDEMAARLDGVRLLLVGESHTALEFHRAQARVVRALANRGRSVLVGLEMFPATEQAGLDRWNDDGLSPDAFVEASRWYEHWGYHWGYYAEIFDAARHHGARMYALNAPRTSVAAVRARGFAALTAAERVGMPPSIDTASDEHLRLFKAYLGDGATHGGMSDEQWSAMFAAQCTWDAAMAFNAIEALRSEDDPDAIMVVMVGSGHVSYGLGIARQAARFFDGRVATLMPVAVADEEGHTVDAVRASLADFVWGLPAERATHYPTLGASTGDRGAAGPSVLFVDPAGAAAVAGVKTGDVIVALDGDAVVDREALNRRLASRGWGDTVTLRVERDSGTEELRVVFRRRR